VGILVRCRVSAQTVYQRRPDDSWAMARDIWNSDDPLPGMPQALSRDQAELVDMAVTG
jgi:hypothetical protein